MLETYYSLGLSDLLENDLSSYEYFNSLPKDIQNKIEQKNISSFEEMQSFAQSLKEEII